MAMPKKGSRKIVVNNNVFVWTIRKIPTHSEKHNASYEIPIQHIDGGQILLLDIGYCRSGYDWTPVPDVSPAIIEKGIRKAIDEGWDFNTKSKPFSLQLDCISSMKSICIDIINRFIGKLENINTSEPNAQLSQIIGHAKEMMLYNEYKIALEDSVSNLHETNILLDKSITQLAHNAFKIYGDNSYKETIIGITKPD